MYFDLRFWRIHLYTYRGFPDKFFTNFTNDKFFGKGRVLRWSIGVKRYVIDFNILKRGE